MSTTLEYTAPLLQELADAAHQNLKIKALKETAIELWRKDQASARDLGAALIAVRDALKEKHGAFKRWYRETGLDENRAYYCIRLVEGKVKKEESAQAEPEPEKQVVQPAAETLLTSDIWSLLGQRASEMNMPVLDLVRQICLPAISAWLEANTKEVAS